MPKPPKVDYTPIIAEYQTGQISVADLAKKYKVKRATLAKYISVNQIQISNNLQSALNTINKGLNELRETTDNAISNNLSNKETERYQNALNAGLAYLEQQHGALAKFVTNLVAKGFKKGGEMLEIADTPEQYKNAMQGIKIGADTLGLFPKSPLVAIQQNINKEFNQQVEARNLQIEINFVDSKSDDKDSEIIDAEIKD